MKGKESCAGTVTTAPAVAQVQLGGGDTGVTTYCGRGDNDTRA